MLTGVSTFAPGLPVKYWFDLTTDGTNFFLAWASLPDVQSRREGVIEARLISQGLQFVDGGEITIDSHFYRGLHLYYFLTAAFDGQRYLVFWEHRWASGSSYKNRYYFARVETDGTVPRRKRRISTLRSGSRITPNGMPLVACATGSCLVTWEQGANRFSVPVVAFAPDYRRLRLIFVSGSVGWLSAAASNGTDYVFTGVLNSGCNISGSGISLGPILCKWDPMAIRVSADNVVLDAAPILLNPSASTDFRPLARPPSVAWDGSQYLISYSTPTHFRGDQLSPGGGPVFLLRLGADGSPRDAEQDGLLAAPIDTGGPTAVQPTAGGDLVVWLDGRLFPGYFQYHPFGSVFAQLLAP